MAYVVCIWSDRYAGWAILGASADGERMHKLAVVVSDAGGLETVVVEASSMDEADICAAADALLPPDILEEDEPGEAGRIVQ